MAAKSFHHSRGLLKGFWASVQALIAVLVIGVAAVAMDPSSVASLHAAMEAEIPEPWSLILLPSLISGGAGVVKYLTDWAKRALWLRVKR